MAEDGLEKQGLHLDSHIRSILICSSSLGCAGILTLIVGFIFVILGQREIGPPYYDSHYSRHIGSSLFHIVGPLAVISGAITTLGNLIMLCYLARIKFKQ